MNWQLYLIAVVLFGGGLIWISRAPAGWNWQKTVASILAIIGMAIPFAVRGFSWKEREKPEMIIADHPSDETASMNDIIAAKKPELAQSYQDIAAENQVEGAERQAPISFWEGYTQGEANAYDPPITFPRRESDIFPVQIGTNMWVISFHRPGPSVIVTDFEMPYKMAYKISTPKGRIPGLKVGRLAEDGPIYANVDSSVFTESEPFCYWMGGNHHHFAKLIFDLQSVPDGDWEIRVEKVPYALEYGYIAPGIPARRIIH